MWLNSSHLQTSDSHYLDGTVNAAAVAQPARSLQDSVRLMCSLYSVHAGVRASHGLLARQLLLAIKNRTSHGF